MRCKKEKPDNNQAELVSELLKIPGMSVETNHDDLFIGYELLNFWVEVKNPDECLKDGTVPDYRKRRTQTRLEKEWTGDYLIASTYNQIVNHMANKFEMLGFSRIGDNLRKFLK